MMEILFLNESSVKFFILTPSKVISPFMGSNNLVIKLNRVVLPPPEEPTIAIFLFGSNLMFNSF